MMDERTFSDIREATLAIARERMQEHFSEFSKAIEGRIATLQPQEFGVDREGHVSDYGLRAYSELKDPSGFPDLMRACREVLPKIFSEIIILNRSDIENLLSDIPSSKMSRTILRSKMDEYRPGRIINFSQTDELFNEYIKKVHPRYTIIFVHYWYLLDRTVLPLFQKIGRESLLRAILRVLNPDISEFETDGEEQEYLEQLKQTERLAKRVLSDPSFKETEGVLQCVEAEGVITTSILGIESTVETDDAGRLVSRALAQLEADNRLRRLENYSKPLFDVVRELKCLFEEDAKDNAILIWQANIQMDAYLQDVIQQDLKVAGGNPPDFDSTTPREIVISLQQLCAALGMFVLSFASVRRMIEFYETNNRLRKISAIESQTTFERFLRNLAENPSMFSQKIFILINDLVATHEKFEAGRAPKSLVISVTAVIRGLLLSMGRIILKKTTAIIAAASGGLVWGVAANAASLGLSQDPLYIAVTQFFQNGRPLLLHLADKFSEYFGYLRSLLDMI